jgi:restriction system-associated AAA family ATPase
MKLLRLKLHSKFRGLPEGFELSFRKDNYSPEDEFEPICLVGLNGSGKSNTLELICEIFYYLELKTIATGKDLEDLENKYQNIYFEIEYKISELKWNQALSNSYDSNLLGFRGKDITVHFVKKEGLAAQMSIKGKVKENHRIYELTLSENLYKDFLPNKIIGYSSGQNELISNPFIKLDFHYFDQFQLSVSQKNVESNTDVNRMFFMDYESNELVVLGNYLFQENDLSNWKEKAALNQKLGIDHLYTFSIEIKFKNYRNELIDFPSELNLGIDKLKQCATTWFDNDTELKANEKYKRVIELHYYTNGAVRKAFRNVFKAPYELFRLLYLLRLMNIHCYSPTIRKQIKSAPRQTNLSDLIPKPAADNLVFRINKIQFRKANNDIIRYKQLSDGEHQLLHIMGMQWLMQETDVFFILDEPETHFNPEWRARLIHMIVSEKTNYGNFQDHFITSHSPFIVSDCKPNNVYLFHRTKAGLVVRTAHQNKINTFGTSVNILTEEIFNKNESQGDYSLEYLNEIKNRTFKTLEKIQKAKEDAKQLGESVEKTLLFRKLFMIEDELNKKGNKLKKRKD